MIGQGIHCPCRQMATRWRSALPTMMTMGMIPVTQGSTCWNDDAKDIPLKRDNDSTTPEQHKAQVDNVWYFLILHLGYCYIDIGTSTCASLLKIQRRYRRAFCTLYLCNTKSRPIYMRDSATTCNIKTIAIKLRHSASPLLLPPLSL